MSCKFSFKCVVIFIKISTPLRMREPLKLFLLFPISLLFKYFCAKQTSEDTKYRCRNSDIYESSPYYQSTSHWPVNRNKQKLSNCHWTRKSKDNNFNISFDILALYLGYSLFADLRQNYDPLPVTTGRKEIWLFWRNKFRVPIKWLLE